MARTWVAWFSCFLPVSEEDSVVGGLRCRRAIAGNRAVDSTRHLTATLRSLIPHP